MAEEFATQGDDRFRALLDDPFRYLQAACRDEIGLQPDSARVGQTHFLLFSGRRLLGGSRLRYRLLPSLLLDGGHIGYEIRPSERGRGHAKTILRLTLQEARWIGLRRILLTAASQNPASIRVIESAGGRPEGTSISPISQEVMRRFWIDL